MDSSFFFSSYATAIGFLTLLGTILIMCNELFKFHQENKIIASSYFTCSSLSPSIVHQSSLSRNWKHHVFPSFHGADVRKSFLSHILKEFINKGIDPFIDNNIERSKSIGSGLIDAIRESRIAIVLLSRNYASSSWCLNELVEIMRCRKKLGQIVMTIFYEVDPTEVKKQTGDFGKVFRKTCKGKTTEEIKRWSKALKDVATIAGEHSRNWDNEAAMIEKIATDISVMLNNYTPSRDFDGFLGMGAHMKRMESLLRLDLDEVRMIGIWGPSGIGKTTIARFLLNQASSNFQLSTIMVNIKGCYPRPCLDEYSAQLQLQNQMLSQMINHKDIMIPHLGVAQERLKDKKVFLVLDDVDRLSQLVALAKEIRWFGPGSRVIITTEDRRIFKSHGIKHIYKVDFPSTDEAFQIFCMNAFAQESPKAGFAELAHEVTYLAGKLPLGLKVMGSYFRGMTKHDWSMELPRLRTSLNGELESILKFSYDALCDEDKDLFLHIACFFNYKEIEKVVEHLANTFLDVRQGLHVLAEKSLISIEKGLIRIHNLLVQLGKEIVRKQSVCGLRRRQFLVDKRDICEVLTDSTAIATSVVGIDYFVMLDDNELKIIERASEGMSNLQFLRFRGERDHPNILSFPGRLNYIFPKLRLLEWNYSPMTCFPFIINMEFLVELIMRHNKFEKLWEGIKLLQNLKWVDLSDSKNLKELPNLSTATSLKELNLSGCSRLVELPSSIKNAMSLQKLDLSDCSRMVELPSSIGNATNLQELNFSTCSSLVELPSFIENATSLKKLDLNGCSSLVKLPSSIGKATNLQELDFSGCSSLVKIPSSIGNATNLHELHLSRCSSLVELPSFIGNATSLKKIDLNGCSSLVKLPSSIGNAINLQELDLGGCSSLVEIPSSIGNATNLRELHLSGCSSLVELPSSIGNAYNLQKLYLSNCSSLVELTSSIGNARNLQKLYLSNCSSLLELPSSIGNATNLQELHLSFCTSLVELPCSIGNLQQLSILNMGGCSKLKILPFNINMGCLRELDLTDCWSLKCFPEISTNIEYLNLIGTSIEQVPSAIRSWSRLSKLFMSYCENLKDLPHALDSVTELHLTNTEIKELGPWVKGFSRLRRLVLKGMQKLVSLSQLPDSLLFLDAENCESLERLDCSFCNPDIRLNFRNCFKLNQEARDFIIHTSTHEVAVLPGGEVPAYFSDRATGSALTVKLNQKPLRGSTKFKVCILLVNMGEYEAADWERVSVPCSITSKHNALTVCRSHTRNLYPLLMDHLYTFNVEAEDVTSTELVFEFSLHTYTFKDTWKIKECGILQLLEVPSC